MLRPRPGRLRCTFGDLFRTFPRTGLRRAVVYALNRYCLLFAGRIRKGAHDGEFGWNELSTSRARNAAQRAVSRCVRL